MFDIRTPEWLRSLDGQVFVDESEDLLCLWRADFDEQDAALVYGMDLFSREKKLWRRSREEHVEYLHRPEELEQLLCQNGFGGLKWNSRAIERSEGRLFLSCERTADENV